ncbi:hypothetical protein JEQ12_004188 [Ovis aries]|uniref:Thioesterase domain-containing protein n=1 Tax=Ovis aries TaxID=9940 RepID=A0A835ZTS1_SHEEP|nr:hypothetical protein JEQ12_004188 [Ovis aries]
MAERGLPLRAGPKEILSKKTCVAMASSDVKPKSISRAKKWSEEIENLYRFQQAGYRDEIEYKQVKQVSMNSPISAGYTVFRNEKVVNCLHQNLNALFRLVCFPWGRGGSTYFAKWGQDIPNFVEGRSRLPQQFSDPFKQCMPCGLLGESRFEEHFASDMHQVVDEIACALLPIIQGENFTFFGHSCDTPSKTRLSCDITCFSGSEDIPVVMEGFFSMAAAPQAPGRGSVRKTRPPPVKTSLNNPYSICWGALDREDMHFILQTLEDRIQSLGLQKIEDRKRKKKQPPLKKQSGDTSSIDVDIGEDLKKEKPEGNAQVSGWTPADVRKQLAIGINEVTRALERNELLLALALNWFTLASEAILLLFGKKW